MQTRTQNTGGAGLTPAQARLDVILAVLLTIAAGVLAAVVADALLAGRGGLVAVLVAQGVIVLIGLQALILWRGQQWRDLGLQAPRLRDLGRGLLALLLVFAVNAALMFLIALVAPELVERHQEELATVAAWIVGDLSLWMLLLVTLFVGLYEEILARGFILGRCRVLLAGIWGPVLVSSILFGLGHLYQGGFGVVQTAIIGILFARLVVHWGTLWPVIYAHAALNFTSLSILRLVEEGGLG